MANETGGQATSQALLKSLLVPACWAGALYMGGAIVDETVEYFTAFKSSGFGNPLTYALNLGSNLLRYAAPWVVGISMAYNRVMNSPALTDDTKKLLRKWIW